MCCSAHEIENKLKLSYTATEITYVGYSELVHVLIINHTPFNALCVYNISNR